MTLAPSAEQEAVPVGEDERRALAQLDALLEQAATASLHLTGPGGETIPLPDTALRLLHHIVQQLARGNAIMLLPAARLLTTYEAADLLNVSHPFLLRLLERGELPCTRVGTHRRIRVDDLLGYKHRRDDVRRAALRKLTRMSQALGLFDAPTPTETR